MTRSQEEYVFHAFKELYSGFPSGQSIRGEQPDYIINSNPITIGVEITQIFIDNYTNSGLNEKRRESLRSMLGYNLCEKLSLTIPFKFVLSIDFSTKDFATNKIDKIVLDCLDYCNTVQFPDDFTTIDIDNFGQLPEEIDSINFCKHSSLKKSFFSESACGVLPDLTLAHLQFILDKKHKALKQYRRCDEHWLLIEEGTFLADSFGDIAVQELTTDFNKVFLYRHAKRQLIQMK